MKPVRAAGLFVLCLTFVSQAPAQTAAQAQAGVQSEPPVVKVLSTGSGAKQPLRYKLTKGAKETINLTMDMSISMDMPGMDPQSVDAPPLKMSMDVEVRDVTANGDVVMALTITSASMEGAGLPPGMLDAVKGLSAVMTMTDRGFIRSVQFDEANLKDPAMKQLMQATGFDRLSAPLPEDAIGVGGKWQVTQRITANGILMDQKSTYEVLEMVDGRTTLGMTIEQSAGSQSINAPGMPAGMQATIVGMQGNGSGRVALADGSLTLYGTMNMMSNVTMDMQMEGQTQRMTTATGVKLSVEPGKRQ